MPTTVIRPPVARPAIRRRIVSGANTSTSPSAEGATLPVVVRPRLVASLSPIIRASALLLAAAVLDVRRAAGGDRVREQLLDYAAQPEEPTLVLHTREGATVRSLEPVGAVAFICDPLCPTVLLTEHIIAALAAGNAVAVALLEPADLLLSEALSALSSALPEDFLLVSAWTGNDWSGVPDDCRMVVLTRTRVHVDGVKTRPMRPRPSTLRSRRSLLRLYSTTSQFTVPIDVVDYGSAAAGSLRGRP